MSFDCLFLPVVLYLLSSRYCSSYRTRARTRVHVLQYTYTCSMLLQYPSSGSSYSIKMQLVGNQTLAGMLPTRGGTSRYWSRYPSWTRGTRMAICCSTCSEYTCRIAILEYTCTGVHVYVHVRVLEYQHGSTSPGSRISGKLWASLDSRITWA